MDWLKFAYALFVIALIIFIFPSVRYWQKNSPRAKQGDWYAFLLPVSLIALFVIGLVWLVGQ